MTELKPCPCGGKPWMWHDSFDYGEDHGVECDKCHIHTNSNAVAEKAIANWNDHPMHKKDEEIRSLRDKIISLRVQLSVIGRYVHDKVSNTLEGT